VWDARGNENEICGEGGMRKTVTVGNRMGFAGRGNGNGRTRNGSLPLTVLISSRDYFLFILLGMCPYVAMEVHHIKRKSSYLHLILKPENIFSQ
jgi:hypothetical protein